MANMQKFAGNVPLHPQWEGFAQHYAAHGSTSAAARHVGVNLGTGSRLINDPRIAKRIQDIHAEQFRSVGITAERVKQELARVAFASAADLFDEDGHLVPLHDLPDDVASTITAVDVEVQQKITKGEDGGPVVEEVVTKKIKRADKMAALALLARHFKIVGAEEDGVNALATALADRLNAAKRRLGELPDVEDAQIIEPESLPAPEQPLRPEDCDLV